MKNCPECGRECKKNIKTTCRPCYQKKRWSNRPMSECHPDRKEHCRGICRSCYKNGVRAKKATCHPERVHTAKGLCSQCYTALPENKERQNQTRRLKKYNLSNDEYKLFLDNQNNVCPICYGEVKVVDHYHETGKVRGILCWSCNVGLGHFKDSEDNLKNAIKYLRRNR